MLRFQQTHFFISANDMQGLPASLAEVAFAGRSNAGKSSVINTLVQQNRLAYVSKTPGRTQLLNFFQVAEQRFLVDLPGYGYASVSANLQEHWQALISQYLLERQPLKGLIIIMDARHPLKALDWQLINWFGGTGKPIHLVLTKVDKLNRQDSIQTLRAVKAETAVYPMISTQLFSSLKKQGTDELEAVLVKWLGDDPQKQDAQNESGQR